jgi:hypothetical protein
MRHKPTPRAPMPDAPSVCAVSGPLRAGIGGRIGAVPAVGSISTRNRQTHRAMRSRNVGLCRGRKRPHRDPRGLMTYGPA